MVSAEFSLASVFYRLRVKRKEAFNIFFLEKNLSIYNKHNVQDFIDGLVLLARPLVCDVSLIEM